MPSPCLAATLAAEHEPGAGWPSAEGGGHRSLPRDAWGGRGTQGWRAFLSLCRRCPVEPAANGPINGDRGALAAGGALAPTAGAPGCVGRSAAGAGRQAPGGEGQGCVGPPHPGIREWLNYSGFAATGAHGQAGGREARASGVIPAVPYLAHGLPPGVPFPLRSGRGVGWTREAGQAGSRVCSQSHGSRAGLGRVLGRSTAQRGEHVSACATAQAGVVSAGSSVHTTRAQ